MRAQLLILALSAAPTILGAQQDPVQRLRAVLPAGEVDRVLAVVEEAVEVGLPGSSVAGLAVEGAAKGRTTDEIVVAARQFVAELAGAREIIDASGRSTNAEDTEAATVALRLGAEADAVSALASSTPSGRSLVVPLLVLGGLADRGLPSDQALAAVRSRLAAGVGDAQLSLVPQQAGRFLAEGRSLDELDQVLVQDLVGLGLPTGGFTLPFIGPGAIPVNGGAVGERPTPPIEPPTGPPGRRQQ